MLTKFKKQHYWLILVLSLFFATLSALAQTPPIENGYNEIFDDNGNVRPQYEEVYKIYKSKAPAKIKQLEERLKKDFQDDNYLLTLPRVLTTDEFEEVRSGSEQRARALKAFLVDHYSGQKNYLTDGIIPKDVLERIIARYGEEDFQGVLPAESIAFWYGPDIIRDKQGKWRVIEDNPAYVGLLGDLLLAKTSLEKRIPEYLKMNNQAQPERFYKNLIDRYKKQAGGKKVVLLQYLEKNYADNESLRIKEIFAGHDVKTAHMRTGYTKNSNKFPYLEVDEDGVWYVEPGKKGREAVGFVVTEIEPADMDVDHPALKKKKILAGINLFLDWMDDKKTARRDFTKRTIASFKEVIKPDPNTGSLNYEKIMKFKFSEKKGNSFEELIFRSEKNGVPGLFDAIVKGKVKTSSTPGLEFIGDKEFYMYVEKLVKYYLNEEPILRNLPTRTLGLKSNPNLPDLELFKQMAAEYWKYVLKPVDGRGGDGIMIGPKENPESAAKILEQIKKRFAWYIEQEYTPLSEGEGYIMDLRYLMDVGHEDNLAPMTCSGRAISRDGNGKVNLSISGRETTVWIIDPKKPFVSPIKNCPYLLKKKKP